MSVALFLLAAGYAIARLLVGSDWPSGFASLAVLIALGASLNAILSEIIGDSVSAAFTIVSVSTRTRSSSMPSISTSLRPCGDRHLDRRHPECNAQPRTKGGAGFADRHLAFRR